MAAILNLTHTQNTPKIVISQPLDQLGHWFLASMCTALKGQDIYILPYRPIM